MSDKRPWADYTSSGSAVRIYTQTGADPVYPIVGEIMNRQGQWFLAKWTAEGKWYNNCRYYDLVPPGALVLPRPIFPMPPNN